MSLELDLPLYGTALCLWPFCAEELYVKLCALLDWNAGCSMAWLYVSGQFSKGELSCRALVGNALPGCGPAALWHGSLSLASFELLVQLCFS